MAAQRIVFFSPGRAAQQFFVRWHPALRELGHEAVYVTPRYHLYRHLKRRDVPTQLLQRTDKMPAQPVATRQSVEVLSGALTDGQAQHYAASCYQALQQLQPDIVVCFNGTNVMGEAIRSFAREKQLQTLFVEIGNLPGKLFADPLGTNAQSRLFAQPQAVLSALPVDMQAFTLWRQSYLDSQCQSHTVPQAGHANRTFVQRILDFSFDMWGHVMRGAVQGPAIHTQRKTPALSTENALPEQYIFLPLQVSSDTQLLLHGGMNNLEAMQRAASIAADHALPLVVKPHPAETDTRFLAQLQERCTAQNILLSQANIFALIDGAREVVTVNSTAGFQAMLATIPVRFLGKSFYAHLQEDEAMARYVQSYLLDIDYFDEGVLSHLQIDALLQRAAQGEMYD